LDWNCVQGRGVVIVITTGFIWRIIHPSHVSLSLHFRIGHLRGELE
jgi:hypothetical protein